ncbi:hypothetical protein JTB14_024041 [Gonioctena quinquepunctata]|nr:hypothetical protein JTB14_024041 [Gonioctena quinquepunctata]
MTTPAEKLKQDFDITENLSDIKFTRFITTPYQNDTKKAVFGEKQSILYSAEFTTFNIDYSLRIFCFAYEKFHEILKLDISLCDKMVEKEIVPCRNFLQRQRKLNTTFRALIEFSKFFEARRLITDIVLSKEAKLILTTDEEGSLLIQYSSDLAKIIQIQIRWKIEWNIKECLFSDVIEVYYKDFDLPTTSAVKEKLEMLTHPSLDFHTKLKLWRLLMDHLHKSEEYVIRTLAQSSCDSRFEAENILVISDSDEDTNQADSDTFTSSKKKRRVDNRCSCDSSVVIVPD